MKILYILNRMFCAFMSFYCDVVEETSMFVWGVLKLQVPNLVRFCIGDLPMYIFFIPTHPWYQHVNFVIPTSFLANVSSYKSGINKFT